MSGFKLQPPGSSLEARGSMLGVQDPRLKARGPSLRLQLETRNSRPEARTSGVWRRALRCVCLNP
eukprot:3206020-Lingulodinium_polyedra.AAC.1